MEYIYINANVNLGKLDSELALIITGFQGLSQTGDSIVVYTELPLTPEVLNQVQTTITNHNPAISSQEHIHKIITDATKFGLQLADEFKVENVLMGITQAGKTGAVTTYLHWVSHYCSEGSLYEAINEIDKKLIAGLPPDLAPFVTADRLNAFKAKLKAYLGIP